ncbi:MAG: 5-bromo-4-chloroindolyl phosphate hydrolysis family protein, partial [Campylobacterota bacterium]|nr:5-bromo-4-chloroindolyl phosphate hydrolysis family protein [Campylobacterota bacterium]
LLCTVSATSAYLGGYSFIASVTLGLAMFLGWYLYYGFDPREDKIEGYDSTQSAQRIMKLLIQANEDIELIKHSAKSCQSNSIQTAMHAMANAFEKIVLHIEAQPDDYERARKYLVSYLGELRSMSQTYIKLELQNKADEMEESFLSTLNSSVEKLDKQYEKLLDDDLMDLDIKLSVMKKRLENED